MIPVHEIAYDDLNAHRAQAYELVTKEPLPRLILSEVRGMDGIKEAEIELLPPPGSKFAKLVATRAAVAKAVNTAGAIIKWEAGVEVEEGHQPSLTLRVAVAHGLGNAKKLIIKMQVGLKYCTFRIFSADRHSAVIMTQ